MFLRKAWTNYVNCLYYKSAHKIQNHIRLWVFRFMVYEISSEDLTPFVRNCCGLGVLMNKFVDVYLYIHVFVNCGISHCGWVLNMWVPKIF